MRTSSASVLAFVLVSAVVASTAFAAPTCPDGQEVVAGKCVAKCPAGTIRVPSSGQQCVPVPPSACKEGEEMVGNKCVVKCPAGTVRTPDGLTCLTLRKGGAVCADGYEAISGACVAKCPAGTVRATDSLACVAPK